MIENPNTGYEEHGITISYDEIVKRVSELSEKEFKDLARIMSASAYGQTAFENEKLGRGREVDAEFADIWSALVYEKHDALVKSAEAYMSLDQESKYNSLKSEEKGMMNALNMFRMMQDGRLAGDYARLRGTRHAE